MKQIYIGIFIIFGIYLITALSGLIKIIAFSNWLFSAISLAIPLVVLLISRRLWGLVIGYGISIALLLKLPLSNAGGEEGAVLVFLIMNILGFFLALLFMIGLSLTTKKPALK